MPKMDSVGAIWEGQTKGGVEKLNISVTIDGVDHKFIAFKNTYKSEDRHPDWRILIPNSGDGASTSASSAPASAPAETADNGDDDLPF